MKIFFYLLDLITGLVFVALSVYLIVVEHDYMPAIALSVVSIALNVWAMERKMK